LISNKSNTNYHNSNNSINDDGLYDSSLLTTDSYNTHSTSTSNSNNSHDVVLRTLQEQRDRMMTLARNKETEVNNIKNQLERLTEEKKILRNDNIELYRRLRVLRTSGGTSGGTSRGTGDSYQYQSSNSSSGVMQSRRNNNNNLNSNNNMYRNKRYVDEDSNNNNDDYSNDIEEKYNTLYESHIDPFKMEELDKQEMMSRRNIIEKALVYIVKFFLQDQWTRHALVLYLALVHVFAIGYVIIVLNPELDSEISQIESNFFSEQETITSIDSLTDPQNWFQESHLDNTA
jgi:hypothetical protein